MNKLIFFFVLTYLSHGSFSWATDFQSPRTLALGGAGHAGPMLNDSIYMNPSYASFLRTYSLAFNYLGYNGGTVWDDGSSEHSGHIMNLSLLDGRTELFQAGVGYTQRGDANIVSVGASRLVVNHLGAGLGVKFFIPADRTRNMIKDATFSTTFIASDSVQLVGVIDNLFESDTGMVHNLYREFILGSKFNIEGIALLYFDPHLVPTLSQSYGHEIGLEFALGSDLFLRLGTFKNSSIPNQAGVRGKGQGFGLGWLGPKLSMDFAVSRVIDPLAETSTTFGLTMYL